MQIFEKFHNADILYSIDESSYLSNDIRDLIQRYHLNGNQEIIEVVELKSHGHHEGAKLLQSLIDNYPHSVIVLKAEPMFHDSSHYIQSLQNGSFDKRLTFLRGYYEREGFININHYIDYDHACAFIYDNDAGLAIIKLMD
jgi:hypothetical protein